MTTALVISAHDNVATALEPLEAGRTIEAGGVTVVVVDPIPRGHKIALRAIAAGESVVKYGSPIGTASIDIAPGSHVHVHNVASQRGRGDLAMPDSPARIAEPPDAADPAAVDDVRDATRRDAGDADAVASNAAVIDAAIARGDR